MTKRILTLALIAAAAAITLEYATQRPAPAAEPLPAAQGDVPQIVIVAKRENAADRHR
jgi:hypothetical protein